VTVALDSDLDDSAAVQSVLEKELEEELYEIRNLLTGEAERHSASRILSIAKDYRREPDADDL
jgi:hypothetical protein